jgi:heavy metal sensor kinase
MLDPPGRHEQRHPDSRTDGLPLGKEALNNASRGLPTFETAEGLEKYPVRILTVPLIEGGRLSRLIQVGMSLQSVDEARTRFLLIMAVLFPMGLLLAGMGGWLLARRALGPVDQMAEAANRISAERLAERLEETGSDDELDRLAKTLNRMLERLDVAFSQIRRFTADASHELKTPLTIMKGELEVALRSPRSPEEYRDTLRSTIEEVDRITQLVEGLLLLARSEAGVLRLDNHQVELVQLAEEVLSQFEALADSRSINLSFGPVAPVFVVGDWEYLRSLLSNLVENGLKYTEPGGRVTLSVQRLGPWASLEISDTGIGISKDEQERIFQPFYRAPEALSQNGAGLGLSIAQSIAKAHGGTIEVESTPDNGSTFRAKIPCASG